MLRPCGPHHPSICRRWFRCRLLTVSATSIPHSPTGRSSRRRAPAQRYTTTPVLLVTGRTQRRDYRDYWLRVVDDIGVLVIAIEFTEDSFPNYLSYHFGNLHDENGAPNPREQWTYGIDDRLFARLRAQGVTRRDTYGLFGHSAGGQFCPSHAVVRLPPGSPARVRNAGPATASRRRHAPPGL